MPTFRQWLAANRQNREASLVERAPIFTPTAKRAGDLVLHSRGWSVVR